MGNGDIRAWGGVKLHIPKLIESIPALLVNTYKVTLFEIICIPTGPTHAYLCDMNVQTQDVGVSVRMKTVPVPGSIEAGPVCNQA